MKRIILPLVFVTAVVLLLGITGFWFVNYIQHHPVPLGKTPNLPITYEEMEELEGNGELAVGAIPRLVACFEVNDGLILIGENSRAFHHDVDAQRLPGKLLGVFFGEHFDGVAKTYVQHVALDMNLAGKRAVHAVILE